MGKGKWWSNYKPLRTCLEKLKYKDNLLKIIRTKAEFKIEEIVVVNERYTEWKVA